MNDKAVSLFENYDFEILKTRKGRGTIIAQTDKGMKILTEYKGYKEKAVLLDSLMEDIKQKGFLYIDSFVRNKENELVTTDVDGKLYVVKDFPDGTECNVKDKKECEEVAKQIARLHHCMKGFPSDCRSFVTKENIRSEFLKRNTELKRVRTFIRKNSAKTDFELLFLKEYERFLSQAEKAMDYLSDEICEFLCNKIATELTYCHGDCSHHNLLVDEDHINIINFEKYKLDTQLKDICLFLRKILEKNDWNREFGTEILDAYASVQPLSKEELSYLYARLIYPEKFAKIANSYLNQRKSLPAKRQSEKLISLLNMEEKRTKFLEQYMEHYL